MSLGAQVHSRRQSAGEKCAKCDAERWDQSAGGAWPPSAISAIGSCAVRDGDMRRQGVTMNEPLESSRPETCPPHPAAKRDLAPRKSYGLGGPAGPAARVGVMAERVAVRSWCGHPRRVRARVTLLDGVRLVMGTAFRKTQPALRNGKAGIQPGG